MFKIDFVILFENDFIGTSSYKGGCLRVWQVSDGASQQKSGRGTTCATSEIRLRPPEVFKPASSSGQGNGQGKNTGCWVLQRQIVLVVCRSIDTSANVLDGRVSQSFTAGNTNQCMWVNSTPSSWVCFWAGGRSGHQIWPRGQYVLLWTFSALWTH